MTTPVTADAALGYGYGLMMGRRFGRAWWGHSGSTFGFAAFLTHHPEEDVTVIVLSNLENGSAADLERNLAAAVLGETYSFPQTVVEADVAPKVLATYEGVYRTDYAGRTFDARIEHSGDHLVVKFPLLPAARLTALSPSRFQGRLKGSEVTFDFGLEDGVAGVTLDWSGTELFAPKLS